MANHGAELYSAAYHGNAASIRKLISRGADLKWRHPQGGATALYVACEFGHAEAAQLLLDSGAPADAARDDGATPLYKACQDGGRTDIVLMLLSAGAQVDQMDNAGMTPLWVACHQGKPVLVRALLDAKADPMRKVQGWGPLDLAKSEGREEIAQLLIEYLPPEAAAAVAAAAAREPRTEAAAAAGGGLDRRRAMACCAACPRPPGCSCMCHQQPRRPKPKPPHCFGACLRALRSGGGRARGVRSLITPHARGRGHADSCREATRLASSTSKSAPHTERSHDTP